MLKLAVFPCYLRVSHKLKAAVCWYRGGSVLQKCDNKPLKIKCFGRLCALIHTGSPTNWLYRWSKCGLNQQFFFSLLKIKYEEIYPTPAVYCSNIGI